MPSKGHTDDPNLDIEYEMDFYGVDEAVATTYNFVLDIFIDFIPTSCFTSP